ncbi:hypothetical protein P691DRAFT_805461 [Macrolepiota fuliginosa MF-IS2]|uniref:Uncharacterized protein n=1 Tax=Macrolepiota fuliginosa MF-IS2 TaxID=1400762 RepID=A0A9P5XA78_9AGAR|nr:hypothetical protein P691DRAFT_805461 [Macrolepiota fuliginosa MF-IS2]
MSSDTLFFTLPRATRNTIDSAFTSVAKKFVKPPESPSGGGFVPESGGFIRDDQDDQQGGGFIRDEGGGGFIHDDNELSSSSGGGFIRDEDNTMDLTTVPTQIPLSMIPSALQILDLPPDDDEVLSVFRNAATGWASSNDKADARKLEGDDEYVNRDDWRSVCAVLLEHDAGGDTASGEDIEMRDPEAESGASDSDEYHESEAEIEQDEDVEDEEYVEGPSASTSRRRTRRTRKSSSVSLPSSPASPDFRVHKLTSRQHRTCVDAYALFFPSVSTEELLSQKIMIKDIQRVAKLLNEKLKAEEVGGF